MPRAERRSHGCHSGHGERRLKAVSRRRRERDSASLEPAIDAADPSAITSTLDLQDSRSLGRRHQDCRLIERLRIEKETVHVEDDGSGYAEGLHIDTLVVLAIHVLIRRDRPQRQARPSNPRDKSGGGTSNINISGSWSARILSKCSSRTAFDHRAINSRSSVSSFVAWPGRVGLPRPDVRLRAGRPVSQYAGNAGCRG